MAIIVQKFGGTSLADIRCILRCARRVVATADAGHQVVVVVSAMGDNTDALLALAHQITDRPSQRELDHLLATGEQASSALMTMALHELGRDATGLSGERLGILTDPIHSKARIRTIDVQRIHDHLAAGCIVVAAGFQGVAPDGHITTLGRGGSDTTAVAIAAALDVVGSGGGLCEIYTDVDGVYTADPRYVPNARKLDRISSEEMLELASLGAGVLHPRAVIFGRKYGVPIRVRSSAEDDSASPNAGTIIVETTPEMESCSVVGCALTQDLGRITIRHLPNTPGTEAVLFRHIAAANILVDDIIQIEAGGSADVSFTVESCDLADVQGAVTSALADLGSPPKAKISVEVDLAKVSAVGVGMRSHTGVAATMFEALGNAGINIANITTSEIKVSCIVPKADGKRAIGVVHDAFGLGAPTDGAAAEPKVPKLEKTTGR